MTDMTANAGSKHGSIFVQDDKMRARNRAEARFKAYGLAAIVVALTMLAIMLTTILSDGLSAFRQASLTFPVTLDAAALDKQGNRNPAEMAKATTVTYGKVMAASFKAHLAEKGISTEGVSDKELAALLSKDAPAGLRNDVLANPALLGQTIEVTVLAVHAVRQMRHFSFRSPVIGGVNDQFSSIPDQFCIFFIFEK